MLVDTSPDTQEQASVDGQNFQRAWPLGGRWFRLCGMDIRVRTEADMDELVVVARRVRDSDRYPIFEPVQGLRWFLTTPEPIMSWVAVDGGQIIGHVALNPSATSSTMRLIEARRAPASAVFVARLLVDPNWRGQHIGEGLLDHARRWAVANGHTVYLEAVDVPEGAVALAMYRAKGWVEVGRVSFDFGDEGVEEVVFSAPSTSSTS